MLDELKEILSNLYTQYGLTKDTLQLSQLIDRLMNKEKSEILVEVEEMYLVRLYMRSTNVIEFKTNNLEKTTSTLTGGIVKLEWDYASKDKGLRYVDISQIEAIVVDEIN